MIGVPQFDEKFKGPLGGAVDASALADLKNNGVDQSVPLILGHIRFLRAPLGLTRWATYQRWCGKQSGFSGQAQE